MPAIGIPYHGELQGDGTIQSDHATPGPNRPTSLGVGTGQETYLVQSQKPPTDKRTASEKAVDAQAFREWRSYALIRGRERYLYSYALGQNGWICFDDNGAPWHMVIEIVTGVSPTVTVTVKTLGPFGRINSNLTPSERVVGTWVISDAEYAGNAGPQFLAQPSPDGRKVFVNYYGQPTYPEIIKVSGIANAKRLCRVDLVTLSGAGALNQWNLGEGLVASRSDYKSLSDLYIEGSEYYGSVTPLATVTVQWIGSVTNTTYTVTCNGGNDGAIGDQDNIYDVAMTNSDLNDAEQSATWVERAALYSWDGTGNEHVVSVRRYDEDRKTLTISATGRTWQWHHVQQYQCQSGGRVLTGVQSKFADGANPFYSYTYERHTGFRYVVKSGSVATEILTGQYDKQEVSSDFSYVDMDTDNGWNYSEALTPVGTVSTNYPDINAIECLGQCLVKYNLVGDVNSHIIGEQGQQVTVPEAASQVALHPVSLQWSQHGNSWI